MLDLYLRAAKEAFRLLDKGGTYIVKTQDEICGGRQYPTHVELLNELPKLGFRFEDLFVLVQSVKPRSARWKKQYHARKNHSYFLVFKTIG